MFITLDSHSYVPPSLHRGKAESIHVVSGKGSYVFFDAEGNVTQTTALGEYSSGDSFYCRIAEGLTHQLVVLSDLLTVQECTKGPFVRDQTEFAPWAPSSQDSEKAAAFIQRLSQTSAETHSVPSFQHFAENDFFISTANFALKRQDIEAFAHQNLKNNQDYARLHITPSDSLPVRESILICESGAYMPPLCYPESARSLNFLFGTAQLLLFTPEGVPFRRISLSADPEADGFYCHIPAGVFHALIPTSSRLILHEVTTLHEFTGPLCTPPWAPSPTARRLGAEFLTRCAQGLAPSPLGQAGAA